MTQSVVSDSLVLVHGRDASRSPRAGSPTTDDAAQDEGFEEVKTQNPAIGLKTEVLETSDPMKEEQGRDDEPVILDMV